MAEFAAFPIKIESVKLKLYHFFRAIRKLPITNLFTNLRALKMKLTIFYVHKFTRNERVLAMMICPNRRTKLGLGWSKGSSTRCRVPEGISNHGKGKGTWLKGERVGEGGIRNNLAQDWFGRTSWVR